MIKKLFYQNQIENSLSYFSLPFRWHFQDNDSDDNNDYLEMEFLDDKGDFILDAGELGE